MGPLDKDIETLEKAVRVFAQLMKRPQRWTVLASRAKVSIDRPSAIILQTLIGAPQACRVQELALQLGTEPPYITRKTQELEQAGYLRRVADPKDRRAVDLRVTARGRSVANRLRQAQRDMIAEALQDWEPAERRKFAKLFQRFSDDLLETSLGRPAAVKPGRADV